MIEAKLLRARHGRVELFPTTLSLAAGRHALLGRLEDGGGLLLSCIAGEVRPKRGELTVLGGSPRDPKVRARIGFVPLGLVLPDVLRVDETLALARRIRGESYADDPSARIALGQLGLEALLRRRVQTLDPGEVRAVALAEALDSKVVSVILIEEPFVSMAAPAASALSRVLAAQSQLSPGRCIIVATSSAHDASRVARDFALFDRGRLLRVMTEGPLRETREVPRIHVVTTNPRALAATLAGRPEVETLELTQRGIAVAGTDPIALAAAVNAAIVDAAVEVQRIEIEPASLDALKLPQPTAPATPRSQQAGTGSP